MLILPVTTFDDCYTDTAGWLALSQDINDPDIQKKITDFCNMENRFTITDMVKQEVQKWNNSLP
jgi:hypothetical protein